MITLHPLLTKLVEYILIVPVIIGNILDTTL